MRRISSDEVKSVLDKGNGGVVLLPDSGGRFVKLSYLWGKLRVDRCDESGNILGPEQRVEGVPNPFTATP